MEWHTLKLVSSSTDEVVMEGKAKSDSPWFSGHFPGDPILPGIAQIAMVLEAVTHLTGGDGKISEVRKVRFKQVIRPDDRLSISVSPGKGDTYAFRILLKGELACNGILSLK